MPFRFRPKSPSPLQLVAVAGAALTLGVGAALGAPGSAPFTEERFTAEVLPLLQQRCLGCHGVGRTFGKLDMRTKEGIFKGGSRGPALKGGDPSHSLMIQMVNGKRSPAMPPNGKLAPKEVALLTEWVAAGAPWAGEQVSTAKEQVWWSFRPVARPPVPKVKNAAWVRNPIDAFVLQKLEAEGLKPSPAASRRILIRRAYLDMLGLPPTPEEVKAFEADKSPDAWEKIVDRLLASKHYGERWGRHWLDLVRYADSCGFEGDRDRQHTWRYRDYVIRSFNDDKPYDRFIKEQLAGDEIDPTNRDAIVATGYMGLGLEDFAMVKLPQARADELDDILSTTGNSMLGLTINCARCHDHKYDPVKQTDYFRLQALFAPTERKEIPIPTPEEKQAYEKREAEIRTELLPLQAEIEPVRARGVAAAKKKGQANPNDDQIRDALEGPDREAFNAYRAKAAEIERKRIQLPIAMVVEDKKREWEPVKLHLRGDANHLGEVVQPGFITSLPGGTATVTAEAATPKSTGRRRALAEWIANEKNPLTARVWLNRVWRQHFGRGIVNTPSNFGLSGETPSHPELLDWLASEFTLNQQSAISNQQSSTAPGNWRLKPIHRLILLSNTYKQASAQRSDALAKDPQNKLIWRVPVRRLEAEAVRDSILKITGALNTEMFGPPVYPPVDPALRADTYQGVNWPEGEDSFKTWRRSVYIKVKRSLLFPQLEVFDCPEITNAVSARNSTTTPLQALLLMNDPLIRRQAHLFAERLVKEAGKDPSRQVERAYALAFQRLPSAKERELGLTFLKDHALADFCHAMLNLNELVYAQ